MRERWTTLLFAIGAFLAFYNFFVGPQQGETESHSRPLSTETRANGYFALRRWLETQGVPVTELRHRFDWLARAPELPKHGNLLVTTIPFKRAARWSETQALRTWIEDGNAVLVAAGLFDTPEWAVPETDTFGQLYAVTGLEFQVAGDPDEEVTEEPAEPAVEPPPAAGPFTLEPLDEPKRGSLLPRGDHPLTRGVQAVGAVSEYPASTFVALTPPERPVLHLMHDGESGEGGLWLTWRGDGSVLVSGYGSIFTNKMLAEQDNAVLMANVIEQLLAPGGHVIFDDMHQGAASFYDAEAFFGDPRLHASFWWIIGLWLVWVLGSTRLPPPAAAATPVRERAFVTATGNLFARVLDRRRVARRLFANFFNDYRRLLGLRQDGEPLWPWLRANGAVAASLVDRLEALHARVAAGRRVNLIELHNRLQELRKQIQ